MSQNQAETRINPSKWVHWVKLQKFFHREASRKILNESEILVSPTGRFGKNYLLKRDRYDDFNSWLRSQWKDPKSNQSKPNIFLPVVLVYVGAAILLLMPDTIKLIVLVGFLTALLLMPVLAIVRYAKRSRKLFKSFHAKFPEAIESKQKVPYPFRKKMLIVTTNPITSIPVSVFLFLVGLGSIWAAYLLFSIESNGLSILILLIGLCSILVPVSQQLNRRWFRKTHGVPLTIKSLTELEFHESY